MPATARVLEISFPFFSSLRPGGKLCRLSGGCACDKAAHEEAVNDTGMLL